MPEVTQVWQIHCYSTSMERIIIWVNYVQTASRALYPPITHCNNPCCSAENKILTPESKQDRKVILFTLEDSACATYHFKLRCSSECAKRGFHFGFTEFFNIQFLTAYSTTYHNNY
jgi:hypothetical protein